MIGISPHRKGKTKGELSLGFDVKEKFMQGVTGGICHTIGHLL